MKLEVEVEVGAGGRLLGDQDAGSRNHGHQNSNGIGRPIRRAERNSNAWQYWWWWWRRMGSVRWVP